jgi:hypothetical protein
LNRSRRGGDREGGEMEETGNGGGDYDTDGSGEKMFCSFRQS